MYYARTCTFKMKLRNCIRTCIALRGVLPSVLQESQGLTIYAFIMLLLVMLSRHMLTFRLMITMVAEFCPLVILIHNTLNGDITISSTWTTRVNYYTSIFQFVTHAKIYLMVIELRFFKKKQKIKNMPKMWKACFAILRMSYITEQPIFV